jgi:hypothetical protein
MSFMNRILLEAAVKEGKIQELLGDSAPEWLTEDLALDLIRPMVKDGNDTALIRLTEQLLQLKVKLPTLYFSLCATVMLHKQNWDGLHTIWLGFVVSLSALWCACLGCGEYLDHAHTTLLCDALGLPFPAV